MARQSVFGGVIDFFGRVGLYDVVLPFLLVFTVVFAILEKTKVFGVEKIGSNTYTRKNLNAMTAFCIAFLVVASAQLVEIITTVSAAMVILLMFSVLFLLLIGSFMKEGQVELTNGWNIFFMFMMFIGLVVIFLNAIKTDGRSWLELIWGFASGGHTSMAVGSIVLIVIIVLFMIYIVRDPNLDKKETK